MIIAIPDTWFWFSACLFLLLATALVMSLQSRNFFTMGVTRKPFATSDLEFPASGQALYNLVTGIDRLPGDESASVKRALKGQLWVDFLFMPGVYLAILLLCLKVAELIQDGSAWVFTILALLQLVAWLMDIIENICLLLFIKNPVVLPPAKFRAYQVLEIIKWGTALSGFFCAAFGLLYFWLAGNFQKTSATYLWVVAIELSLFVIISKKLNKKASPLPA